LKDFTIKFVTDIHELGFPDWLAEAQKQYDLLIIGGDIGPYNLQLEVSDFIQKHDNIVAVWGNHDEPVFINPRMPVYNKKILHGTTYEYKGLTIAGVSGGLPSGGWPFEVDESEFGLLVQKLPNNPDIFVSHEPPYDTKCDLLDTEIAGLRVRVPIGSASIRAYILHAQPIVSFHGHIHESRGQDQLGESIVINPGAAKDGQSVDVNISGRKVNSIVFGGS
jgi:uncharacterized protein